MIFVPVFVIWFRGYLNIWILSWSFQSIGGFKNFYIQFIDWTRWNFGPSPLFRYIVSCACTFSELAILLLLELGVSSQERLKKT